MVLEMRVVQGYQARRLAVLLGVSAMLLLGVPAGPVRQAAAAEVDPPAALPGTLTITAQRLWPLARHFEVADVVAPGLGSAPMGRAEIGYVTSDDGGFATVVRRGDTFSVEGLDGVGEYHGKINLGPGIDAGNLDVVVRVRDVALWPLAILLIGLGLANLLDRFTKRSRPADVFELRLARLLDDAEQAQRGSLASLASTLPDEPLAVHRIRRAAGEAPLLLDREVEDARKRWRDAADEADRDDYLPGQAGWEGLSGQLDALEALLARCERLAVEVAELQRAARDLNNPLLRGAPSLVSARALLRPEPSGLVTRAQLDAASERAAAELDRLGRLRAIVADLTAVWSRGSAELRGRADRQLRMLWEAAGDLDDEQRDAAALYDELREEVASAPPEPVAPLEPRTAEPQAPAPPEAGEPTPGATPPRRRIPTAVTAGLAVLALVGVGVLVASVVRVPEQPPPISLEDETTPPEAMPYFAPQPMESPAAPQGVRPSTAINLVGLLVLLVLGALAWGALDARVTRGALPPVRTVEELAMRLHRKELSYGVLGAILVVLSGMSFQYFPNPTFGSAGDYLGMLLWGTAVGEGVKLARRFLPQPAE